MHLGRLESHRTPFGGFTLVDLIGPVLPGPSPVGGHNRDLQLVGLLEFHLLCLGGTGHSGQAGIQQEEVLIGDGGKGLRFRLNRQALLGFNGLVLTITPAPAGHHSTCKFINDHRLLSPQGQGVVHP